MIKILIASHVKDSDKELKDRVEYRYQKMNDNPVYVSFKPQLTKLQELFLVYTAAMLTVKNVGGPPATKAKNKAKDNLSDFLKLFNTEIQVAANKHDSDEAALDYATGSGADVSQPRATTKKKPLERLEMPANFFVENDRLRKGAALAGWDESKDATNYVIEEVDDAGVVKNSYYCTKPPLLIQGTESEVKKTYQMMAIGPNGAVSDMTETFTVWVR